MRSLVFVIAGIVLWALAVAVGKWWQVARQHMLVSFCGIWFAVALINMWLGVSFAGYSLMQELPFFLIIFFIPVVLAVLSSRLLFNKSGD